MQEGQFVWTDGSPWQYTNWMPNQPNNAKGIEDCVMLGETGWNGKWADQYCGQPGGYICSYNIGKLHHQT